MFSNLVLDTVICHCWVDVCRGYTYAESFHGNHKRSCSSITRNREARSWFRRRILASFHSVAQWKGVLPVRPILCRTFLTQTEYQFPLPAWHVASWGMGNIWKYSCAHTSNNTLADMKWEPVKWRSWLPSDSGSITRCLSGPSIPGPLYHTWYHLTSRKQHHTSAAREACQNNGLMNFNGIWWWVNGI